MVGSAASLIRTFQQLGTKMILYLRFHMDNTGLHVFSLISGKGGVVLEILANNLHHTASFGPKSHADAI
jgi:hypothetical protein